MAQLAETKGIPAEEYTESLDLMNAEDVAAVLKQLNIYPDIQYNKSTAKGRHHCPRHCICLLQRYDQLLGKGK